MKTRLLACVSVAVLFVVTPIPVRLAAQNQSAEEQQKKAHLRYRVRDLGTLGGTFTQPGGINDKGEIEGFGFLSGDTEQHAFYWQKGHLTVIPGLGGPNSIAGWAPSETGQVGGAGDTSNPDPLGEDFCGFGTFLSCHPFVWRRGTITPLPLPAGNNAVANGFNNRNQVVGKAESADPDPTCPPPQVLQTQGVIWKYGQIEKVLPNFPGDMQGSGHSINDRGQVVGWSGSCFEFVTHALLWDHGKPTDLGTISGDNNIAYDINNQGQVVGFSGTSDVSFLHAFLWEKGRMMDLGTLPGDAFSQGVGINDNGDVVGGSFDVGWNERAFIWHKGIMADLNTLIPSDSPLFLIEAEDLNSGGQIIGVALEISSGEIHAFVATPREDGDLHNESELAAASRQPQVTLPESTRKLIQQRLSSLRLRRPIMK